MADTYAEYELNKIKPTEDAQIKFRGDNGDSRWISILPETLAQIEAVLKASPECSWAV